MRRDGKRAKNLDLEYAIAPHIMSKRNDALNMIELDIPAQPIQDYINAKRKEGIRLSHMSVVTAAYLRTVYEFPLLNNFIVNKKIYTHKECCVLIV